MSDTITARVNALLRAAMAERGLSRADMARALKISRVSVTKALNNPARDWGITTLEAWAQALGCEMVIKFAPEQDEPTPHQSYPD